MNVLKGDKKSTADEWLENLKHLVGKKPLVVFQFDGEEWSRLEDAISRAKHGRVERERVDACFPT